MAYVKIVDIGGNETVVNSDGSTRRVALWEGMSTDPDPKKADGVKDSDRRYVKDTKKAYVFDEGTDTWYPL